MAKNRQEVKAQLIPKAIALLNDFAEAAGLSVRVSRINDPVWEPGLVVVEWSGPKAALFQAVKMPRSWRFPLNSGAICIPNCEARGRGHFLRGRIATDGDEFTLIARERAPKSIRYEGAIEIADYGDEVAFFGSRESLIAAGICTTKHFPEKHANKEYRQDTYADSKPVRQWATRRHQSGDYCHVIESEARAWERFHADKENCLTIRGQLETEGWRESHQQDRPLRIVTGKNQASSSAVAAARKDAAFQAALSRMLAGARKNPD